MSHRRSFKLVCFFLNGLGVLSLCMNKFGMLLNLCHVAIFSTAHRNEQGPCRRDHVKERQLANLSLPAAIGSTKIPPATWIFMSLLMLYYCVI